MVATKKIEVFGYKIFKKCPKLYGEKKTLKCYKGSQKMT